MEYSRHFKFLICAPAFDPADLEGQRLQAIADEIEADGYGVMKARKVDDAELVIQTDAAVGCVLLDWGKRGPQGKMAGLVTLIRKRGLDMPIIILVRHHRLEDIPVDVLREADGYVFLAEETPDFIAKNLISRLRQYAETLKRRFLARWSTMRRRVISSGPAQATTVAYSTPAARSAGFSSSISGRRSFATISTTRCWTLGIC
jgi:ornithine decarboxylase